MSELSDRLEKAQEDFKRALEKTRRECAKGIQAILEERRGLGEDTEELKKRMEKVVSEIKGESK